MPDEEDEREERDASEAPSGDGEVSEEEEEEEEDEKAAVKLCVCSATRFCQAGSLTRSITPHSADIFTKSSKPDKAQRSWKSGEP